MSRPDQIPSAAELVEALLTLTHAIRRRHNVRLASYDSSVPRSRLLRAMVELGTPRMSDLAAHLGLTARTITTAVDALEREGLLARRPAPGDRRATLVELTPAGQRHIKEWQAFQRQLSEEVMAPLSADERRQLIALLERIRTEGLGEAPIAPYRGRPRRLPRGRESANSIRCGAGDEQELPRNESR